MLQSYINQQPVLQGMYDTIAPAKWQFLAVFSVILLATYGFFAAIDFLPEPPAEVAQAGVGMDPETVSRDTDTSLSKQRVTSSDNSDEQVPDTVVHDASEVSTTDQDAEMLTNGRSVRNPNSTASAPVVPVNNTAALPIRMHIDALDRTIPILNPTSRAIADLDAALNNGAVRHPDAADFRREGNIFILGHSSNLPNVINRNFQIFNGIENLRWGDIIRLYSEDTEFIYRVDRVYEARANELVVPIADTGPRLTLVTCNTLGAIEDRFIVEAELQSSRPL